MKYTITIDKQTAPNTFDSVLVFCDTDFTKFVNTYTHLIHAFMSAETIQKVYWKYEEGFTHLVMEIKLL